MCMTEEEIKINRIYIKFLLLEVKILLDRIETYEEDNDT